MKAPIDRRAFLKLTGASLGIGTLYTVTPIASGAAGDMFAMLGRANGEALTPFTFVQFSDAHVGFNGPADPLGTQAFERAVEVVNRMTHRPDLVLFTGDLTHDSEDHNVRVARMQQFKEIAGRLKVPKLMCVPGEHDAGIDEGALYHEHLGDSHYSFDHRGVHFIGLDNVSRAKPEVGPDQIAWLKKDLARFPKTAPIVLFTHRPLFDLKPEWEWFTSDGDAVLNLLAPYQNVTVLYGHIHRHDEHVIEGVRHYGARSLIFAFPDPAKVTDKKPIPFDKAHPFNHLGIRELSPRLGQQPGHMSLAVTEVELTLREFSGINGMQQLLKTPEL